MANASSTEDLGTPSHNRSLEAISFPTGSFAVLSKRKEDQPRRNSEVHRPPLEAIAAAHHEQARIGDASDAGNYEGTKAMDIVKCVYMSHCLYADSNIYSTSIVPAGLGKLFSTPSRALVMQAVRTSYAGTLKINVSTFPLAEGSLDRLCVT